MPTDDQRDDPRVQRGDSGLQWNRAVGGEHPFDGGDPIAALRAHFTDNAKRLSQQIDQTERELRSLHVQHDAFIAGLQALDRPNEMPDEY
jgi:hypothetical protein